jgi:hypothetical protein
VPAERRRVCVQRPERLLPLRGACVGGRRTSVRANTAFYRRPEA